MRNTDQNQAKRVAWRHVLRWLQAQLALIEIGQASTFEIFLPYMYADNERTVAQLFAEKHKVLLLPAGESK